jgi:hypothetical protein
MFMYRSASAMSSAGDQKHLLGPLKQARHRGRVAAPHQLEQRVSGLLQAALKT